MKTTVDISDSLLHEARRVAARQGLTLRAVIERGLHRVIDEAINGAPFKLRRASVGGNGLQPDFSGTGWEDIRDAIYRGRGA